MDAYSFLTLRSFNPASMVPLRPHVLFVNEYEYVRLSILIVRPLQHMTDLVLETLRRRYRNFWGIDVSQRWDRKCAKVRQKRKIRRVLEQRAKEIQMTICSIHSYIFLINSWFFWTKDCIVYLIEMCQAEQHTFIFQFLQNWA